MFYLCSTQRFIFYPVNFLFICFVCVLCVHRRTFSTLRFRHFPKLLDSFLYTLSTSEYFLYRSFFSFKTHTNTKPSTATSKVTPTSPTYPTASWSPLHGTLSHTNPSYFHLRTNAQRLPHPRWFIHNKSTLLCLPDHLLLHLTHRFPHIRRPTAHFNQLHQLLRQYILYNHTPIRTLFKTSLLILFQQLQALAAYAIPHLLQLFDQLYTFTTTYALQNVISISNLQLGRIPLVKTLPPHIITTLQDIFNQYQPKHSYTPTKLLLFEPMNWVEMQPTPEMPF